MSLLKHATARTRLHVGLGAILCVWYLIDLAVHYKTVEALFARQLGTLWARLFMAVPVVGFVLFSWYRLSREAHQSSTAPNNRWSGP